MPVRVHHPECVCVTCSTLQIGQVAYRELAEALASDDPAVLDPLWRHLCQQRVDAYNQRDLRQTLDDSSQHVPVTDV